MQPLLPKMQKPCPAATIRILFLKTLLLEKLHGKDVSDMWHMLIERAKGNLNIEFANIKADGQKGTATWIATYHFTKTNRKVINKINASFEFKDGLIIKHTDSFDFWNWAKQALGTTGLLLGWSSFLHKKVQHQALESLRKYQQKLQS